MARAGTCPIESEVLRTVASGNSLILTWDDDTEHVYMSIGPDDDETYIVDTLRPALLAVQQGCFHLWSSTPTDEILDLDARLDDTLWDGS